MNVPFNSRLCTQKYSYFNIFSFHQANVETGRSVHQIPCKAAMNSVEWNPKYNLLAYAGDDKNKYQADEGSYCGPIFVWSI